MSFFYFPSVSLSTYGRLWDNFRVQTLTIQGYENLKSSFDSGNWIFTLHHELDEIDKRSRWKLSNTLIFKKKARNQLSTQEFF